MKFSIIMPVYNASKYIKESINSVLNQTYDNFELLLVNDGSTDNTLEMLNDVKKNDHRIVVLNQKNQGPMIARLNGIKNSLGDYIMFIDADDIYDLNTLEEVYKLVIEKDVDLLLFNSKITTMNNEVIKINNHVFSKFNNSKIEKDVVFKEFLSNNNLNNVWSKVIKSEIVQKDKMNYQSLGKLLMAEDRLHSLFLIHHSENIYYLDKALYNYRTNVDSLTFNYTLKNLRDNIKVQNEIDEYLFSNLPKKYQILSKNHGVYYLIGGYLRYITMNKITKKEKRRALKIIKKAYCFYNKNDLTFRNKILYSLINKERIKLLNILSILNKRRMKK